MSPPTARHAFATVAIALIFVLICAALGGCADYRFAVNDRVVYNPDPLFTDYQIPDAALERCVAAVIERNKLSSAAAVEELDCRDSDVISLLGLETFVNLRYLNVQGSASLPCASLNDPLLPQRLTIVAPPHCPSG